ncbi:hypothetical protein [Streptomyces caniscabiei]|uniref:Uncharacterized protein n=1 Tax=Streptomyces caniscabiei TaxID=2746961 RepID=A0ABU4MZG9_9ACTN|nr:hypothetical protein [Streptomyces caniscabiei]MBE4790308.1 hypothetical protein [Streptomyces caniscabiei]MBE4799463.1 hypothetical protein [Streptomyces caniscabiei]MDX3015165.1 hypothetical protein [Streptomyces caniscabiei]MDX3042608.1 hypothetical protein [Streptomyces caniscabiei]
MAQQTQWNGEPCTAMRVSVVVADSKFFPGYWAREFIGTRRDAVLVEYGGSAFYLDDHDGSGWNKVTHGGSPRWGHRDLVVEPGSVRPRRGPVTDDTSTPGVNDPQPRPLNRAARRALARRQRRS